MTIDIIDLRAFYNTSLGSIAARVIGGHVAQIWQGEENLRVLGLGYAVPYLEPFQTKSERVLAFMLASQGVVNWPSHGASRSSLVDPSNLPLPEASIDRVLMVHALESVQQPAEVLSELWRILTPGGRILIVVPNRRGLWARMDTTPFGYGQPFSSSQIKDLLRKTLFTPDRWVEALYVPPVQRRFLTGAALAWEKIGTKLSLPFGGVHLVEASKQLYRPITVHQARRVLHLPPVLVPAPTGATS